MPSNIRAFCMKPMMLTELALTIRQVLDDETPEGNRRAKGR
jgi:hypothetical protein